MPTVTLDEREWQVLIQLVVNAMINANPVLLKVIAQVQQPGSSLHDRGSEASSDRPRGNGPDPQRSSSEERGSEGEHGSEGERREPGRAGW